MAQQMMETPRKRKKAAPKLEFSPESVFDMGKVKAEDLELDIDSARYVAMKGQGGDRRA